MNQTETHIYIAELNNYPLPALEQIKNLLPETEFTSTQNFATENLKTNALRTKILTRSILAKHLNLAPKAIPILRKDLEKPKLAPPFNHFDFNIAHTKDYFALALTQNALIGIDIESTNKHTDILGIAKRFFHPEEYQALLTTADPQDLFFRIWTQKEAFVKAIGKGLSFGLEKFCVDTNHAKILKINTDDYQAEDFYSRLFSLPQHHYVCITSNKPLTHLNIIYI